MPDTKHSEKAKAQISSHADAYRGCVAAKVAGITYRQLDYWARTDLLQPSVQVAEGSGTQRLYAFADILVLKLIKRLLDAGVSLQQIRAAVQELRGAGIVDLSSITLMSDGASVYLCNSNDEVIDLVHRGQGVFGIFVGHVLKEVEENLLPFACASPVESSACSVEPSACSIDLPDSVSVGSADKQAPIPPVKGLV